MSFNPFEQKVSSTEKLYESFEQLFVKPYNKATTDPFTKLRVILMNGTEFEANWYSHQFSRHCGDNDIRREVAAIRRSEQQQQKKLAHLKPLDETILETTIGYEQLAVELTANLARREKDPYVKKQLDFALLEDFDHLYRFSNLLMMEHGIDASKLVGKRTEITPGRPTIAEHRFPMDDIRHSMDNKKADPITKLNASIITAAEQQTMNYYMNVGNTYTSELGKKMYLEIAMIEEEHVTEYGSLLDTSCTWLAGLLEHEYTECYLYYSCMNDEIDKDIKKIWEICLMQELAHLHKANELLKKYEKRDYTSIYHKPEFPELISFGQNNIEYVRDVLKNTVCMTSKLEEYQEVCKLNKDDLFFAYNNTVNPDAEKNPNHMVIDMYIKKNGQDFRFETAGNPVKELSDRTCDNTNIGRTCTKK